MNIANSMDSEECTTITAVCTTSINQSMCSGEFLIRSARDHSFVYVGVGIQMMVEIYKPFNLKETSCPTIKWPDWVGGIALARLELAGAFLGLRLGAGCMCM